MASGKRAVQYRLKRQDESAVTVAGNGYIDGYEVGWERSTDTGHDYCTSLGEYTSAFRWLLLLN
jgi:hypothetical protein